MDVDPQRLTRDEIVEKLTELNRELAYMGQELARKNRQLKAAQAEIKVLRGKISICMHCKKIQDQNKSWEPIEKFISENSEAWFSHSICPDCMQSRYGFLDPG